MCLLLVFVIVFAASAKSIPVQTAINPVNHTTAYRLVHGSEGVSGTSTASLKAVEAIMSLMQTSRQLVVDIENRLDTALMTPSTYCSSGYVNIPPVNLYKKSADTIAFTKAKFWPRGSAGVITFDVARAGAGFKLAILFSIPFDYNLYENVFGFAVVDRYADEEMFDELYLEKGFRARNNATLVMEMPNDDISIYGTMNEGGLAHLKIIVETMKK